MGPDRWVAMIRYYNELIVLRIPKGVSGNPWNPPSLCPWDWLNLCRAHSACWLIDEMVSSQGFILVMDTCGRARLTCVGHTVAARWLLWGTSLLLLSPPLPHCSCWSPREEGGKEGEEKGGGRERGKNGGNWKFLPSLQASRWFYHNFYLSYMNLLNWSKGVSKALWSHLHALRLP